MDEIKQQLQASAEQVGGFYVLIARGLILYFVGWELALVFYRLFLSPLRHIPGPKIAAATGWYEFYYDVVQGGQYIYKIEAMHRKYGPIVRINPHEIVVSDADFYNENYVTTNTRRTNIWTRYRTGIGFNGSHAFTTNHELHRRRRKPLEPYFSRAGIDRIEGTIVDEAKLLSSQLEERKGTQKVVRLDNVFSAFAADVIGRVTSETPADMIKNPEFGKDWQDLIERMQGQVLLFMHIPTLASLMRLIPTSLLSAINPGAASFNEFRDLAVKHIEEAKAEKLNPEKMGDTKTHSIFRNIISSDLPESELSVERLSHEAMVLLVAGTATTARTMSFISYYLLENPHMKARLQEELRDALVNYPFQIPKMAELEKLPYLQAVIKEGLRCSYGVMRRLPRCSPDVALQYKQYTIPKGTPVGCAAYSLHTDPEVYPEPFKFIPERWLGNFNPRMNKNWVPFTRGSRNCLGINLAMAELTFTMAILFRPGGPELSLYETNETDVAQARDMLIPLPKLDTRGLRVMVN